MKILIVDDDADLRALVAFALTQAGYTVVKAAGRFELRDYASHLIAETVVEDYVRQGGGDV